MDKGVGQRGSGDRSAEAARTEGPKSLLADKVDSGADLFLAGTEQEDEQRLRASAGERRSPHLRGDESPYGEAFGSLMRLFRQLQAEVRRTLVLRCWMNTFPRPRVEGSQTGSRRNSASGP